MNTTEPSRWDLLPPRDRLKLTIFRDAEHQGFKIPTTPQTKSSRYCSSQFQVKWSLCMGSAHKYRHRPQLTFARCTAHVCRIVLSAGKTAAPWAGSCSFVCNALIFPSKALRKLFNEKVLGRVSICSQLDSLAKSEAHKALLYFLSWYISKSPQYSCFLLNEMEQSYSHQSRLNVLNAAVTKLSLDNQELQFLLFVNFLSFLLVCPFWKSWILVCLFVAFYNHFKNYPGIYISNLLRPFWGWQ